MFTLLVKLRLLCIMRKMDLGARFTKYDWRSMKASYNGFSYVLVVLVVLIAQD